MSEPTSAQPPAAAAEAAKSPEPAAPTSSEAVASTTSAKAADTDGAKPSGDKKADEGIDSATAEKAKPEETRDSEMKDDDTAEASGAAAAGEDGVSDEKAGDAADAKPADGDVVAPSTPADKASKSRRKSTSASASKNNKKLKKQASRARLTNLDAQPGDHYFVKLKGYPRWPAIICDEDMLPQTLIKTRPVTAKRKDGTYREDYADGGKRAHDRTFPVMYLATNEFGWVPNTDLDKIDATTVGDMAPDKASKDLKAAYELAAKSNDLEHYKDVLLQHQEDLLREEEAKQARVAAAEEAAAAKEARAQAAALKKSAAAKSSASKKTNKAEDTADEDVEMADAPEDDDDAPVVKKKASSKKRKAEEEVATPQRSDSVKKPKIKLTTSSTPKTPANGATPQSAAAKPAPASEGKSAKSKPKKASKDKDSTEEKKADKPTKEDSAPKEPELTAEEKHVRKEKEVLFLRHKLQKGLLTRDQEPKAEEMKTMSDYVTKLEAMPELEVSIIRATKINKVLKGILKLENIPREDEIKFKPRSQALLDKWNKLLLANDGTGSAPAAPANGVNGDTASVPGKKKAASKEKEKSSTPAELAAANGVAKENGDSKAKSGSPKEGEKEKKKASDEEAAKAPEATEVAA